MKDNPWVGIDLDGTLAEYHGWQGEQHIGPMVVNIKNLILQLIGTGFEVKIFTARVAREEPDRTEIIKNIQDWLVENGLPALEVTNVKDYSMVELYDDRAVQVKFNTGEIIGESTLQHRRLQPNKEK